MYCEQLLLLTRLMQTYARHGGDDYDNDDDNDDNEYNPLLVHGESNPQHKSTKNCKRERERETLRAQQGSPSPNQSPGSTSV